MDVYARCEAISKSAPNCCTSEGICEYTAIVKQQVTELWTQYGQFARIWIDSGLGGFETLMEQRLHPLALRTHLVENRSEVAYLGASL